MGACRPLTTTCDNLSTTTIDRCRAGRKPLGICPRWCPCRPATGRTYAAGLRTRRRHTLSGTTRTSPTRWLPRGFRAVRSTTTTAHTTRSSRARTGTCLTAGLRPSSGTCKHGATRASRRRRSSRSMEMPGYRKTSSAHLYLYICIVL